jgi:hypothetical protein
MGTSTSLRKIAGDTRVFVTDQDSDVSTSVAGANGYETIYDLSPDTDISYLYLAGDDPQLGSQGNLRLRLQLPQEGGGSTEIGDDANIRIIAQGPQEDKGDTKTLGRTFTYGEFSNTDQYDNEDVVRLDFEEPALITEAAHLKIQVDNSTNGNDVDLSQTGGQVELETFRRSG